VTTSIAWQLPSHGELGTSIYQQPQTLMFEVDTCHVDVPLSSIEFVQHQVATEGDQPRRLSRPFLSLELPEWVHEKAVEDEMAGIFRCRSLASFTASATSSPSSSPAISPKVSAMDGFPLGSTSAKSRFRSGVCWADLTESEEDGMDSWCAVSAASTATSSPAFHQSLTPKAHLEAEDDAGQVVRRRRVSWADLVESEIDPVNYLWSSKDDANCSVEI
jgi:hypothetical protein